MQNKYLEEWRKRNPDKVRAYCRKRIEFEKTPEWRAINAAKRRRLRKKYPEREKEKREQWLAIPGNRERWYAYCRDRLARKPWIGLIAKARFRAKKVSMECTLTNEWAEQRWTGKCELSRLEFVLQTGKLSALSPSIDRIDSAKGYTPDNCRIICWALNRFRGNGTDAEMLVIAKALIEKS